MIRIKIVGCVKEPGYKSLPDDSSLKDAINIAKGFATKPYPHTGIISIRNLRKSDGKGYLRRRININKINPSSVMLRNNDFIVAQYNA